MKFRIANRNLRVLDFDVECRPLSWYGGDWVTKDVTAIAWKFIGENDDVVVRLLGLPPERRKFSDVVTSEQMLEQFLSAYNEADMVTGHFIRGFDLPVINAALTDFKLPLLGDKLTQDTKNDLTKRSGMSNSQESLAAMLGLKHPKIQMDQDKWRKANRLLLEGLDYTRERVVGDVVQHIEMRARMLELNMLRAPSVWTATSKGGTGKYHA